MTALGEARADGEFPFASRAPGGGRPLRPLVQGVHAGHGEGRLRRARQEGAPRRHFTIGIVDDVTHTVAALGPLVPHRGRRRLRLALLRPRRGRHRGRQQELHQDHRPGDRPLRPGLLRLRLQEVRGDHGLAPALEPAPHPLRLPGGPGELRGLPPVRVRGQDRRARARRAGRRLPAERARPRGRRSGTTCPREMQEQMVEKRIRFFAIDAYALAKQAGMGGRINTIMQTCFFAISGILPARGGDRAHQEVDREDLRQARAGGGAPELRGGGPVPRPPPRGRRSRRRPSATRTRPPLVSEKAPDFVQKVTAVMLAGKGDLLPVSAFPVDGTWPMGTAKWEKRNLALEIPVWDSKVCIQCNQCALVCPHAAIRAKVYDEGGARRRRPRPSSRPPTAAPSTRASSSPSRWRPRTAPAATSA